MAPRGIREITLALLLAAAFPAGADWTHWRGPDQDGTSPETGLIATWSKTGDNLIWRDDFAGRSTPVVFDGRVCAIGRIGEDELRQELVACWDAGSGKRLWQYQHTVHNTDVPWNRVGWASPAADAETGYLFAHTVDGLLYAFDRDGKIVWQVNLAADYGRLSGYGGRTHSPIVDEDLVILGAVSAGWGEHRPPRHRYFAFDKKSGEVVYVATPGGGPAGDLNTQSTPVIAEIGGQRLLIGGNADGWVHAIQARTGTPVWKFQLSQRGLNASVAVSGDTVIAGHSEENLEGGTMGAVVAIDGKGRGDITASHEKWRIGEMGAGFPSPVIHDGIAYVADNSANLHAVDLETGAVRWSYDYGTVGKSSPVWADGKIYLTEVNGNVEIIAPGKEGAEKLDHEHLEMPDGRYAEIYASPAVAYGRVYFTTEEGIYALGDKSKPFSAEAVSGGGDDGNDEEPGGLAQLLVVPADVVTHHDRPTAFSLRGYDAQGRRVALRRDDGTVSWSLAGLAGTLDDDGAAGATLHYKADAGSQLGKVEVAVGKVAGSARVRVAGPLPWHEDFEQVAIGEAPAFWLPAFKGTAVQKDEDGGGKILQQPKAARGAPRAFLYLGPADMTGYTVQADIRGGNEGRRYTDLGLIAGGYTLDLQGAHQRLQARSWSSERRMARQIDFPWEMGVWYTMKLRVDPAANGEGTLVRGKVWKRGEPEPAAWTITVEDPLRIPSGAPGIYTFAPVASSFDNVKVMVSQ